MFHNNAELRKRLFEQLKAQGYRAKNLLVFNQQLNIRNNLSLNYAEFLELMHELSQEGYFMIEPEGPVEHYRLTEKIEEEY